MKAITLIIFMLNSYNSFSQRLGSASILRPMEMSVIAADSAKIALDVHIGSSGKFISATNAKDGSTLDDEKMIAVAKRKAGQIKYPAQKQSYTQRLIFNFIIAP